MKTAKRLFSLLLALALCLALMPAALAEGESFVIRFDASFELTEARGMLAMVNGLRTGEDAWQLDQDGNKVYLEDLGELQYSYALEEIAMQRAAEIALSFSHTRPNGTLCYSCLASDGNRTWGENIAAGYSSAAAVFEGWCETNEDYDGQGHRRNMLKADFVSIGIGHAVVNGTHYWVQEFSYDAIPGTDAASEGVQTRSVEVAPDKVSSCGDAAVEPAALSLNLGETARAPEAAAELKLSGAWPDRTTAVRSTPNWTSADESVAKVENGTVTAVGAGETTLSATAFGVRELTVPVTVTGTATPTLEDGFYIIRPDWTLDAIDPAQKFVPNDYAQGEYMLGTTLTAGEKIKVVKVVNGELNAWYPDGFGNEYTVDEAHAGKVTIYFRDAYYPDWSAFGGYFYIEGEAPAPVPAEIYGASLSLKGNIGLNFYVFLPESLLQDGDAYVTLDGVRIPVAGADTETINGRTASRFSAAMPVKEMQRRVTLRVFDGQGQAVRLVFNGEDLTETGYAYSVEDYLDETIATVDSLKLLELAYAMRDYGSCAQLFFDYEAENRAEVREDLDQVDAAELAPYAGSVTAAEDSPLRYNGMSLLLRSNTVLRCYFRLKSGSIEDFRFSLDGESVTPVQYGEYWYVEKSGITARDLDVPVTVRAEQDGQLLFEASCSPLGYADKVLNGSGEANLQLLMKAMFRYWQAAEDYFR